MKFSFRPSIKEIDLSNLNCRRHARLKGRNTLRAIKCKSLARNYRAENFGKFEKEKRNHPIKTFAIKVIGSFKNILSRLRENRKKYTGRSRISPLTLFGALCGASCVALLSALIIVFSLFFGHIGSYTSVSVPELVSLNVEEAIKRDTDFFEYEVIYKTNPTVASNEVTAQNPLPGVMRKLYGKDEKIKITLTVNTEQEHFTLPRVVGASLRDISILLKKANINANVIKQYSSSVPYGKIIHSSVSEGTVMKEGDSITLRVSLGKEVSFHSVPNLLGLNEYQAADKLRASGLEVGDITYETSKKPIGTVISQSVTAGSTLREQSKVSFTLSGGIYFQN